MSKNVTSCATQTVYKVAKNSVDKMTKINALKRVNAKYSWKAVSNSALTSNAVISAWERQQYV